MGNGIQSGKRDPMIGGVELILAEMLGDQDLDETQSAQFQAVLRRFIVEQAFQKPDYSARMAELNAIHRDYSNQLRKLMGKPKISE